MSSIGARQGETKGLQCCHHRLRIGDGNGKKGQVYGFDGGKNVKGRKRHIVVESQGLIFGVLVSEAKGSER